MRKIINVILFIIIINILFYLIIEKYNESKIKNKENDNIEYQTLSTKENTEKIEKQYPKEQIINQYQGHEVSSKLKIPKIDLETYILQNYSEEALKISITKFWGVDANQIGNFCVAGHNFRNKNMFSNLKKLEIGDIFEISDNVIGIVEYKIYDIYQVEPEDVSCLSQNTEQKREVTLITCTTDSKKRIIVKAKEIW